MEQILFLILRVIARLIRIAICYVKIAVYKVFEIAFKIPYTFFVSPKVRWGNKFKYFCAIANNVIAMDENNHRYWYGRSMYILREDLVEERQLYLDNIMEDDNFILNHSKKAYVCAGKRQ